MQHVSTNDLKTFLDNLDSECDRPILRALELIKGMRSEYLTHARVSYVRRLGREWVYLVCSARPRTDDATLYAAWQRFDLAVTHEIYGDGTVMQELRQCFTTMVESHKAARREFREWQISESIKKERAANMDPLTLAYHAELQAMWRAQRA